MKKIRLNIIGLSYSQTQSGAYALVLAEENGERRLPIIIGAFEAQSIAIALEKDMLPPRPLTHDLFKAFASTFDIEVTEVLINKLQDGVFFASLVCEKNEERVELDARTSDAVALAIRFGAPIFTFEEILSDAGIILDDERSQSEKEIQSFEEELEDILEEVEEESVESGGRYSKLTDDELRESLKHALDDEDYEKAALIRDEMAKRKMD
jgi:bifunctional DNase/RNase